MSVSGRKLSPKRNPVTHHAAALKQLAMPWSIPAKLQRDVCDTHTHTRNKRANTPHGEPALHSLIQPTHRSPITLTQGYLISQDVYRLFPVLLTLLRGFCNGGGRPVPRDEGVSQNQEALDLAEGYF